MMIVKVIDRFLIFVFFKKKNLDVYLKYISVVVISIFNYYCLGSR